MISTDQPDETTSAPSSGRPSKPPVAEGGLPAPGGRRRGGSRTAPTGKAAIRLGAVALALAVWLYMMWAFRGQPGDDPYVTYRYAYNLAHGNGFVFNAGERVQSTTTPLFTLILALGGLAGLDIPAFGYWLSGLCLLAFGACCVGLVWHEQGTPWPGFVAVLLTFLCPVTTFGLGTEMPLLVALAWGSWWAAARNAWLLCALAAGLAAVTRGDGVLVGAAVAISYFGFWILDFGLSRARNKSKIQNPALERSEGPKSKIPWGALALYLMIVAPWYIFSWLYFGSPLPATLGAKIAQGTAPGTVLFLDGLRSFWALGFGDLAYLWVPALLLLLAGLVALIRRDRGLSPTWIWAALFVAGFSLLRVPRYPWYYSPLVPVAMLALVFGGGWILDSLRVRGKSKIQNPKSKITAGALLVCLLVGAIFLWNDSRGRRTEPAPRYRLYAAAGHWLATNTPPEASLGAEEVGMLGYFSNRRIVDFVGLLQPEVAPHRARGDNLWALRTYHPDYILAFPPWLAAVGSDPWVKEHYSTLRTFDWPGSDQATLLKSR